MHPRRSAGPDRPKPRLVVRDGRHIDQFPAATQPESTLYVSFAGLTEAEQRLALSAFPGGRRFRLVGSIG